MIHRSNRVSYWVASMILWCDRLRERAQMYAKMVELIDALRKVRNFSSAMGVLAGLNMSAIHRLTHTKNALPERVHTTKAEAEALFAPQKNFQQYRDAVTKQGDGQTLPYLGVYLTQLTFIEDGNPDNVRASTASSGSRIGGGSRVGGRAHSSSSAIDDAAGRRRGTTLRKRNSLKKIALPTSSLSSLTEAKATADAAAAAAENRELINFNKRAHVYRVRSAR